MTEPVRDELERLVKDGPELGLQVAAFLKGDLVVDAWAGKDIDGQTLFTASSNGKGVAATCIHLLAERGLLDYEAPVATYWPEFGVNGKQHVTVRHVLTHRAGVPNPPEGFDTAMMIDWDRTCAGIANLPLAFEPGTQTAYHNYTFGYITGELVQRIDGRPIQTFLQQEICQPLKIDSLFFGVPASELARVVARVSDNDFNRDDVRQACIPSSGLITNARSLARHYALLAEGGTLDGVTLLSSTRIKHMAEIQTDEMDVLWNVRVKRGLGYRLGDDAGAGAGPGALGHVGAAMFGYADPNRRFAMAFLKNYIDQQAGWQSAKSVYASIERSLGLQCVTV